MVVSRLGYFDLERLEKHPLMMQSRPRRILTILGSIAAILLVVKMVLLYDLQREPRWVPSRPQIHQSPSDQASNATLGFQKIIALSTGPSWRTRGLQAAAAYSGIDIDILPYIAPSPEMVAAFSRIGENDTTVEKRPPLGSATAWLAHLDVLKHVVHNDYDTVLIVEDDVDWDVTIKAQLERMSPAVRLFTKAPASDDGPYGRQWDVLWIGHCGECTDPDTERLEYPDSSVLPVDEYQGWSAKWVQEQTHGGMRNVQYGVLPVCTFAYAVTKQGARRVLDWAGDGKAEAFDTRLSEARRGGYRLLDIVTLQPELMHHYQPLEKDGYVSQVKQGDGRKKMTDESRLERMMGGTENVPNSARCKALFDSTCRRPNT